MQILKIRAEVQDEVETKLQFTEMKYCKLWKIVQANCTTLTAFIKQNIYVNNDEHEVEYDKVARSLSENKTIYLE